MGWDGSTWTNPQLRKLIESIAIVSEKGSTKNRIKSIHIDKNTGKIIITYDDGL